MTLLRTYFPHGMARRFKLLPISICTFGLLASAPVIASSAPSEPEPGAVFRVQDLEGLILKTPALEDYDLGRAVSRRRIVLFLFPGIWDPISVHTLKTLRNHENDLAALNFQIIAVSSSRIGVLAPFVRKENIPFVLLADPESSVAARLHRLRPLSPERKQSLAASTINWTAHHGKTPDHLPDCELLMVGADGIIQLSWKFSAGQSVPDTATLLELARQAIAAETTH